MSVEYTVKLNNAQEVKAWEQAIAAQVKHQGELKKSAKEYKAVSKEVDELIDLVKIESRMEEEAANKRQKRAREAAQAWDAQTQAVQRFTASLKQTAVHLPPGAHGPMPPHLQNAILPWLKPGQSRNPMAPWVNGANQTAQALKQAGQAGQMAFGDAAVSQLSNYAAGVVSISAAINLARTAFDKMDEIRQKALTSVEGVQDSRAKLAQLPGFASNMKLADQIYAGGVSRPEAYDIMYASASGGLSKAERDFAAKAGKLGPGVGSGMAEFETSIKNIFPGVDPRAAGNAALRVAGDSPKLEFAHLVKNAPAGFSAAGKQGLNMAVPEMLAVIEKMSLSAGTPEEALERFEVLAGRLSIDPRFRGKGIKAFDELARMSDADAMALPDDVSGLSADDAEKFLGKRKEMREGIRFYRAHAAEVPAYAKELEAEMALTGTGGDAVSRQVKERFGVPIEAAAQQKREEEAKTTLDREAKYGVEAFKVGSAVERAERLGGDRFGKPGAAGARYAAETAQYFGGGETRTEMAGASMGATELLRWVLPGGTMMTDYMERQLEELKRISASNEEMAKQGGPTPERRPPPSP